MPQSNYSSPDSNGSLPILYICENCKTEYETEVKKNNCSKQMGCPEFIDDTKILTKEELNALIKFEFPTEYTEVSYSSFSNYLSSLPNNTESTAYPIKITEIPKNAVGYWSDLVNTEIGGALSRNPDKYVHLTFDDSLKYLGNEPLGTDINVVSLYIPDSTISAGAFYEAPKLKYLRISNNLSYIFRFDDCPLLETIVIPKNVNLITQGFKNCTGLKNLILSNSVTKIERDAFEGCENLSRIYFKGTKAEYHALFDGKLPTNPKVILIEDYDN